MPLVSVGLPVRNGEDRVTTAIRSVLEQDHRDLELVVSDNASTDATEDVCRELARSDPRVRYVRQTLDLGLLGNFRATMRLSTGTFFRWIGDDDLIDPTYLTRCLEAFRQHPEALLVTTQLEYVAADGTTSTPTSYDGTALASPDPMVRLQAMLRLLNQSHLVVDPLYALMRREPVLAIPRRNTLREDELFATRLAVAGPWEHVPETLGQRHVRPGDLRAIARRLGVPAWQVRLTTGLLTRAMLADIARSELTSAQRRAARTAVAGFYIERHARTARHRAQRASAMVAARVPHRATQGTLTT
jgi:hypothetical protein